MKKEGRIRRRRGNNNRTTQLIRANRKQRHKKRKTTMERDCTKESKWKKHERKKREGNRLNKGEQKEAD